MSQHCIHEAVKLAEKKQRSLSGEVRSGGRTPTVDSPGPGKNYQEVDDEGT